MSVTSIDHAAPIDALVASAFRAGAAAGIMEAHALLVITRQEEAADRLLKHWDSIIRRASAHEQASAAIEKARQV